MQKNKMVFKCVVMSVFMVLVGVLPGCPLLENSPFMPLQKILEGCNPSDSDEVEESYIPEGPTQHWKSKETIGNLRGNLGIYLDINMDANGVFNGKIGNYIYQSFPGYGGHYATYEDLKKTVCGKLNVAEGTGVVWPEEEEKTTVTVTRVEDTKLIVTFKEWPSLDENNPPGATMWKM